MARKPRPANEFGINYEEPETDVLSWNPIEIGRCGTDSILSIGYGMRHRWEIEEWAAEYGFSLEWR
jgi:hypothetical protein